MAEGSVALRELPCWEGCVVLRAFIRLKFLGSMVQLPEMTHRTSSAFTWCVSSVAV
jgi:hypothetical protein